MREQLAPRIAGHVPVGEGRDDVAVADQAGDRKTLKADSFIPLTMAAIYLLILLYFKSIGGYKALTIDEEEKKA